MFKYLDLGAILTICVFPFIGLIFNIIWVVKDWNEDD